MSAADAAPEGARQPPPLPASPVGPPLRRPARAHDGGATSPRVTLALGLLLLAESGVFFAAGIWFARWPICGLMLLGQPLLLAMGFWVLAGAVGLPRRWPMPALTLATLLATFLVVINVAGYLAGLREQVLWNVPFRPHPVYGHAGVPGARGYHWLHPDFRCRYSFDEQGWRIMPTPTNPRGSILMLGCSYTFGTGVNDDETYPAVLARDHWPHYRVLNRGFPMFGTVECWVVLGEALQQPPRPAAVCYGFIDDHLRRNWLRHSWHQGKAAWGARVHHVEVENGQLVDHGLIDPARATADDSQATLAHEEIITRALVREMARMCRERQVPFYLLALNQRYPIANRVVEDAQAAGVEVLDLRRVSGSFFPHDTHPTARWDAAIAGAIAGDPRLSAFGGP